MTRLIMALILCVLLASPCLSWEKAQRRLPPDNPKGPVEGPAIGVAAVVEPSVSFTIITRPVGASHGRVRKDWPTTWGTASTTEQVEDRIRFYATAGPGLYDADSEVVLLISSNQDGWAIAVQAAPLDCGESQIPGDQVFVHSDYTDPDVDEGGGAGYVCIGDMQVVARGLGHIGSLEVPLRFRLKTTHMDKVGTYAGALFFSYLIAP